MNYAHLLSEFNEASAFDLYRLYVAINNELANPNRILSIKRKLQIGMELSYLNCYENRLVKATVLELKQKRTVVRDHEKNKCFIVPYYMLDFDERDLEIDKYKNMDPLTANTVKVGDCVGFNKDGVSIVGIIKRINGKTVTFITKAGHQWRVAYSHLYRVHEAEITFKPLTNQKMFDEG